LSYSLIASTAEPFLDSEEEMYDHTHSPCSSHLLTRRCPTTHRL
jgi:hypothetical protein